MISCRIPIRRRLFSTRANSVLNPIVLYQRAEGRANFQRSVIGLATLNTMYWLWYTVDFIPTVNQSPVSEIHIDSIFGYFGIGVSLVFQGISTMYPLRLISKLEYNRQEQNLMVYNYSSPLVFPMKLGNIYTLGQITLRPDSAEAMNLQSQGDFLGTIALTAKQQRTPLFIDIQEGELKDPKLFAQVLITPWDIPVIESSEDVLEKGRNKVMKKRKKHKVPFMKRSPEKQ
mmetsp:Transcript_17536/g.26628  ORF Transcript_17536/g.26628 Transcript_17536/m.26628 type:complete len:230 (-) Transcript_17536:291-980(-)